MSNNRRPEAPIFIRRSTPADGEALVAVWRSSVDATHSFVSRSDLQEIAREVQQLLPLEPLWVAANEQDLPVAFLGLVDNAIDALFVAGPERGRGIGRTLVELAMQKHSSLATIVNEQNLQAIGFYERMGFRKVGRSPNDEQGRPYPVIHMLCDRS